MTHSPLTRVPELISIIVIICTQSQAVQYGTNVELPYYVRAGIERVRAFKQGGSGCGIEILSQIN